MDTTGHVDPSHSGVLTHTEISARVGVATKTVQRWLKRYPWLSEVPETPLLNFFKMETEEKTAWAEEFESEYAPKPPPSPTGQPPHAEGDGFRLKLPADFTSKGRGLRVEVEALAMACEAARQEWGRLAAAGHKDWIKAFSAYEKLLQAWRQIAKDAPKALQELNDSISKEEAQAEWMKTLNVLSRLLDNLPVRFARLMVGVGAPEAIERGRKEIRQIKLQLQKGPVAELDPVVEKEEPKTKAKPRLPKKPKVEVKQ